MLNSQKSSILALIVAAAFVSPLGAQELIGARDKSPVAQMTPAQQTFAQEYIAAITGSDIERYKRLLHPRTRACINADNADFFNNIFSRRVGRSAKNPRTSLEKITNSAMFSPARSNGVSYPARPSHLLHINLVSTASKQYALSVYLVRETGLWYEVLPCPSAKSLVALREATRKDAEENLKARAMADSLQDPLRTELVNLLQAEGPLVATQRYAEATQVDPALARRVVKALEKDLTLVH